MAIPRSLSRYRRLHQPRSLWRPGRAPGEGIRAFAKVSASKRLPSTGRESALRAGGAHSPAPAHRSIVYTTRRARQRASRDVGDGADTRAYAYAYADAHDCAHAGAYFEFYAYAHAWAANRATLARHGLE